MKRSYFSVLPLVVLMSFLLKNGDPFTIVQHIYKFTKEDVRLDCPFAEGPRIVWKENDVGETIAINGTISSTNPKYNNFDVSIERDISSLTINRAEIEDDGIYSCHTPTKKSLSFWLHMQNPPTLSISINGIVVDTSIDVDENTEVIVECNATGADPPVYVSLSLDDEPLTLDEQIMDNYTHTAYSSSRLTVEKSHREIVCIDSEQKLSMYKKTVYLNVNYKGLSDDAIFAIAISVAGVLLVGFIVLRFFKSEELPVYATASIDISAVALVGLILVIIIKRKEWWFYLIVLIDIVVGVLFGIIGYNIYDKWERETLVYAIVVVTTGFVVALVPFIGFFFVAGKELSVGAIAAIDIVVIVPLGLPVAFAVVVLLVGLIRWIDKGRRARRRARRRANRPENEPVNLKPFLG